jgi:hypothetical protein
MVTSVTKGGSQKLPQKMETENGFALQCQLSVQFLT